MPRRPPPSSHSAALMEKLELLEIATLRPHPRNDRIHPPEEIAHLTQSITEHGVYRNVVIAEDGTILAGRGVVQAAQEAGETHVPGLRKPYGPDDPRALKILVGDNHIARLSGQDDAVLARLLQDIAKEGAEALLGTGFDAATMQALAEAQGLLGGDGDTEAGRDVEPQMARAAELQQQWGTAVGQVWTCGVHTIMCGDCTEQAVVERLMRGREALLCHADPPYGMGKEAEGIANDNLYASKLDAFQMAWWRTCRPFLADNASVYLWGNAEDLWRLWYVGGLRDSERLTFRNEVVWDKGDSGAGVVSLQGSEGLRKFPPGSERCLFFMLGEQGFSTNADNYWDGWEPIRSYLEQERLKMGWDVPTMKRIVGHSDLLRDHWTSKSQWTFPTQAVYEALQRAAREQAKHRREAEDRRDYEGFKRDYEGFKRDYEEIKRDYEEIKRDYYATRAYFDNTHDLMTDVWPCARVKGEERFGHPTPKPLALIERMITSSSPLGGVVYEPFLGSGTTLIACENLGRVCFGCEIDPGYVAITLQRWHNITGEMPTLVT